VGKRARPRRCQADAGDNPAIAGTRGVGLLREERS
jgi:hypothetical protein